MASVGSGLRQKSSPTSAFGDQRIQDFWRGASFWYADDGQELSYHLAQFILSAVYQGGSTPPDLINEFILAAGGSDDAGATAVREVLGFDFGELLERFLGEGDWNPVRPD